MSVKGLLERAIVAFWYRPHPLRWLLWPLAKSYEGGMWLRRCLLKRLAWHAPVPVIVVGNLTVGGVGKTPLVIAMAKTLTARGYRVGIVSRGYGARIKTPFHVVRVTDHATQVGDEPLLLAEKTGVPVVIARQRVRAVKALLAREAVDIVVSDDGLQHERLGRTIEIVVVDGARQFGNGLCLPAGPLREGLKRLKTADFVVINGASSLQVSPGERSYHRMDVVFDNIYPVKPSKVTQAQAERPIWKTDAPVAAIAGIGHPERFFSTLKTLQIPFVPYVFPNHHVFQATDFAALTAPILMTEKDAVKCRVFATEAMYALSVHAVVSPTFWEALERVLAQ